MSFALSIMPRRNFVASTLLGSLGLLLPSLAQAASTAVGLAGAGASSTAAEPVRGAEIRPVSGQRPTEPWTARHARDRRWSDRPPRST